jgi:uncharacterized protein YraI
MKKIMSIIISICLLAASCPALAASAADFSDVKSSDWYYSAVDYVTGMGLFSGTSATAFSPKRTMNRAMFVTVLGRYAGVSGTATADVTEAVNMRSGPGTDSSVVTVLTAGSRVNITGLEKGWYAVTKGSSSGYVRSDLLKVNNGGFSDVSGASYYCAYVNWCSANGIASGTGGTSFSPSAAITREQICAILYRYAQKFGVSLPETVSAAAFSDDAAISASARDGVYAMQRAGVVSGRGGNAFCPRATASRAEVAAIMMRFIECVKTQPKPDYGYAGTVPASAAAADGYFDDACFIGHSIVVGMSMYLGLPNAQYYAVNGISAKRMLTYDGFTLPDGGTGTVSDALTGSSFGKVYIMLGVNELGSSGLRPAKLLRQHDLADIHGKGQAAPGEDIPHFDHASHPDGVGFQPELQSAEHRAVQHEAAADITGDRRRISGFLHAVRRQRRLHAAGMHGVRRDTPPPVPVRSDERLH